MLLPLNDLLATHRSNTYHLLSEKSLENVKETAADMSDFLAKYNLPSFQTGCLSQPITPALLADMFNRAEAALNQFQLCPIN